MYVNDNAVYIVITCCICEKWEKSTSGPFKWKSGKKVSKGVGKWNETNLSVQFVKWETETVRTSDTDWKDNTVTSSSNTICHFVVKSCFSWYDVYDMKRHWKKKTTDINLTA